MKSSTAALMASMGILASQMMVPGMYQEDRTPEALKPKPKVKREPMPLTDEESAQIETLELDRSSPGRKRLKLYKQELNAKYRGQS